MSFSQQLFTFMDRRIVGQERAIQEVVRALTPRLFSDLPRENTLGAFLLVGPSGTGKTKLAESLAEFFLGDPGRLLRWNCLLLQQGAHNFDQLSSHMRLPPPPIAASHTRVDHVILLENVEKSSKVLIDFWNYVLTRGYLQIDEGVGLSFRRTLFLLKSAVAEKEVDRLMGVVGFADPEATKHEGEVRMVINRSLENTFPSRFLGNLTRVVHFRQLHNEDLAAIQDRIVEELREALRHQGVDVILDRWVHEHLLRKTLEKTRLAGAKGLRQTVIEEILYPVQDLILSGRIPRPSNIWVKKGERGLIFCIPENPLLSVSSPMGPYGWGLPFPGGP